MNWKNILKRSFIFSLNPKRWCQPFLLDSSFCFILLFYVLNLKYFLSSFLNAVLLLFLFFITILFYTLLNIWINGAIVYQSYREKKRIGEGYKESGKKYLSLLASSIIAGIILGLIGIIPYIGFVLSILFSLAFFFIYQGIIIRNLKFDETLRHSVEIFKKRWDLVFAIWFVLALICFIVILIFSTPLILLLFKFLTKSGSKDFMNLFQEFINLNMASLIISEIILLVGISISKVFSIKAKTEFYLQIMKKKIK